MFFPISVRLEKHHKFSPPANTERYTTDYKTLHYEKLFIYNNNYGDSWCHLQVI